MHPIVVVTLIFIGIGGAYFLATNLSASQAAVTGASNNLVAAYGPLAAKILVGVLILYGIYYVADCFRTAALQRKAKARLRNDN